MNVPIDKLMDAEIDTGMVAVPEIGLPDRDMLAASLRENPDNFAPMSAENRQRVAEFLKSTRQQSMQDIETALLAGASGPQAVKAIADLHDHMIQALFDYVTQTVFRATNPTSSERICIAAVGGYGRGSLAPESDIDLLFLLPYKQTPWGESVVEFMLYILWDTGLKVGNSTRSVDECVRLSHGDMTIRTALLESRFICGDAELFADLQTRYSADVAADRGMTFVNAKLAERTDRHRRQGETRYLVEPNIKEGKGGLRDLHTLYWIAKYIYGIDDVAELVARDVLTKSEFDTFCKAEAFLWLVRCHLHYYTGRPIERLSFDIQPAIAKRLNYADHDGLSAVEWFMKDYFRVAKEVGDLTRIFCAVLEEQHRKPKGIGRFLPRFGRRAIELEAFVAEGGRLNITHESVFTDDPANLLRLFHMAQHNDIDIHPDALRLVTRSLHLIDDDLRANPEANRLFLEMLCSRQDPETTLRRLNEAGVFGAFVPDFGRIVAMMQFNMYHHYTVDEHLIRAIGILSEIENGQLQEDHPVASEIMPRVKNREVIYLAVLLHDIAKGRPEDHSDAGAAIARELCPRLGLSEAETELTAWLVENHLLMSDVAQKRDIADPKTVSDFAQQMKSMERLRLMLVLTVVDIRAVGPGVWNSWKGQLIRQLYYETESILSGGHATAGREQRIEAAKAALKDRLQDITPALCERILAMHYPPYWLTGDTDIHEKHARLMADCWVQDLPIMLDSEVHPEQGVTEITLFAPDHPGLFSRVAGAFASAGAVIVDAKIFTTAEGMALDIFWVQDREDNAITEKSKLRRLSKILNETLSGKHRPHEVLKDKRKKAPKREAAFKVPSVILFDNDASSNSTLIEVTTRDRPGLLHELTWALFGCGLSITSAHVTTYGEEAVDTFYVRDAFGLKITNQGKLDKIRTALLTVLEETDLARNAAA